MIYNSQTANNPLSPVFMTKVRLMIRQAVAKKVKPILYGSYSNTVVATTTFTITFGGTRINTNYQVIITPTSAVSAATYYIDNKTLTTFDVKYVAALTGTITFDWLMTG